MGEYPHFSTYIRRLMAMFKTREQKDPPDQKVKCTKEAHALMYRNGKHFCPHCRCKLFVR